MADTATEDAPAQTEDVLTDTSGAKETPKAEGTQAAKPADAKPADQPEKPAVPEKYELKLPDDSLLSDSTVERTAAYAKERGLSNEQAQELLEAQNREVKSYADAQMDSLKAQSEEWKQAVRDDNEIGGDKFNASVEMSKRVLERFGNDQLKTALVETYLGNHPEVIRFLAKIGRAISEDSLLVPGMQTPQKAPKSHADVLYGAHSDAKDEE